MRVQQRPHFEEVLEVLRGLFLNQGLPAGPNIEPPVGVECAKGFSNRDPAHVEMLRELVRVDPLPRREATVDDGFLELSVQASGNCLLRLDLRKVVEHRPGRRRVDRNDGAGRSSARSLASSQSMISEARRASSALPPETITSPSARLRAACITGSSTPLAPSVRTTE